MIKQNTYYLNIFLVYQITAHECSQNRANIELHMQSNNTRRCKISAEHKQALGIDAKFSGVQVLSFTV